jgi:hypothetical protein
MESWTHLSGEFHDQSGRSIEDYMMDIKLELFDLNNFLWMVSPFQFVLSFQQILPFSLFYQIN